MTSFRLPSDIFPENAITRAEFSYQQRSAKKPRSWRRWLNRTFMLLVAFIALIQIGGLFIASLTQRDPTPIVKLLEPFPSLLLLFAICYHFYLMLQTISLTANSITREKQAQTWELLVLTGVNARQIVRGKWWVTVQRQFSRYLFLGLIRSGATATLAISLVTSFYFGSSYYNQYLRLPHPITILVAVLFGMLFTIVNLVFSAACGVMSSAVSQRSSPAILRGFVLQIVISVLPALIIFLIFTLPYNAYRNPPVRSIFQSILWSVGSVVDNGFNLISFPLYVDIQYYRLGNFVPISPVTFDWMISALLALGFYILLIWFTLWRAEKRAVRALATPVD